MPDMNVIDLGRVRVTRLPKRVPKTIADPVDRKRRIAIDSDLYLVIWAVRHMDVEEKGRVLRRLEASEYAVPDLIEASHRASNLRFIVGFIKKVERFGKTLVQTP